MERRPKNNISKSSVINDKLLKEHTSKEKDERLDTVSCLRLNFLNILKIDHLWMLKSLRKLNLSHNGIEAIENLNELTNLKELDLSFNRITRIENVHELKELEVLSFSNNKIEILENMDSLGNLVVFCIAENLIGDQKQFIYLRRFRLLRSLSLKNNPCCENKEFEPYIKAILPMITYLNYSIISQDEKNKCRTKFNNLIRKLEREEESLTREIINRKSIEDENDFNYLSFVEYLNDFELFDNMFDQDRNILVVLNSFESLTREYEEYKTSYGEIMREFVDFGHSQYYEREKEIKQFQDVLKDAREKSVDKSKMDIYEFSTVWKKIIDEIASQNDSFKTKINELDEIVTTLWEKLMNEEVTLYEQCEETRNHFATSVEELSHQMLNMGKIVFNKWREKELIWTFERRSAAKKIQNEDTDDSEDITLLEALKLSEIDHMQFINDREELLIARVQKWKNELINSTNWEEINRNRRRILEIVNLIDEKKSKVTNVRDYLAKNEQDFDLKTFLIISEP